MPYDGLGPSELARRLGAPRCLSLVKVTSTLDIVHELAAEGAHHGTLVLADEQVTGRGRQGRRWHSPPGRGIWLGYLVRPRRAGLETGVLALRVGLAVADTVSELGAPVRLKWPNDIVARDRKLAGILCEARWHGNRVRWIAVGLGMNVHGPLPEQIVTSAIALERLICGVHRVEVLERLVPKLLALPDAPELSEGERAAYRCYDWLAGRELVAPLRGHVRGVDAGGALLVETPDGVERLAGGHIVAA